MVINDEKDDVHALIACVFRRRKQCRICNSRFVCRVKASTFNCKLFGYRQSYTYDWALYWQRSSELLKTTGRSIHLRGESIHPRIEESRESICSRTNAGSRHPGSNHPSTPAHFEHYPRALPYILRNDGGLLFGLRAGMRERKKITLHLLSICRV